ncbi:MAG: PAS domain S-box protein [Proteobacteria bacterium]|nr:PAS domain S-box protein [Pseudomonadota bacterium]
MKSLDIANIYKKIVEESPAAILVIDSNGNICIVNEALQNIFGYAAGELLGKSIEVLVPERNRMGHVHLRNQYFKNPLSRPMHSGMDLPGLTKSGQEVAIQIGLNPIVLAEGIFIQATVIDMQVRLKQEHERKNLFLEEIHHRVKNNLALITSVVQMEKRRLANADDDFIRILTVLENRIRVLGRLHENLYQGNFETVNLKQYLNLIATDLEASLAKDGTEFPKFNFVAKMELVVSSEKAICFGLMFNEFCTNSIKHAFKDMKKSPKIEVNIEESNEKILVEFADNGKGVDPNQEDRKGSIGKKIISILSRQIGAEALWPSIDGTKLSLSISKDAI